MAQNGATKADANLTTILLNLETARTQLQNGFTEKGLEMLVRGIELINQRMRCLKIADSSPAGWDTVNEYLSSPLARGDEDDKRLKRAEKVSVDRMNERLNSRRGRGRGTQSDFRGGYRDVSYSNDRPKPYYATSTDRDNYTENNRGSYRAYGNPRGASYRSPSAAFPIRESQNNTSYRPRNGDKDCCYYCGSRGHWADKCPEKARDLAKYCKYYFSSNIDLYHRNAQSVALRRHIY